MNDEELAKQLLNEFESQSNENLIYNNERDGNNDESAQDDERNQSKILNFVWIEGLRTGSRLVWVPSEESLYYANAINKKNNAIACTCYEKKCKKRIFILEDGTSIRGANTSNHSHGTLYNVYKERYLYTYMKERCRTAPASAVIRDIYNEAVTL